MTKFTPDGAGLVYSTYLSCGAGVACGIALDAGRHAYVTGVTYPGFPSYCAVQSNHAGGSSGGNLFTFFIADAFVMKLDPSGSSLVYSTFLGGSGQDGGGAIALDATGNAYIAGATDSTNFPTTAFAFQRAVAGTSDAFVAKIADAPFCTPAAVQSCTVVPPTTTTTTTTTTTSTTTTTLQLKVTGGGQIQGDPVFSPLGDLLSLPALVPSLADPNAQASFGFVIQPGSPPTGNLEYDDRAMNVQIKAQSYSSLSVTSGSCGPRTHAEFSGIAAVIRSIGTTTEPFTVKVDDCGEPGTSDRFGIMTTSYANGPKTLIKGNIQIQK